MNIHPMTFAHHAFVASGLALASSVWVIHPFRPGIGSWRTVDDEGDFFAARAAGVPACDPRLGAEPERFVTALEAGFFVPRFIADVFLEAAFRALRELFAMAFLLEFDCVGSSASPSPRCASGGAPSSGIAFNRRSLPASGSRRSH
jgi:hypothetical protein